MKVLAVDTSSEVATVAVIEDESVLAEYHINHKRTHSQCLMPMIRDVLAVLELKVQQIDLFAAASGPGSFTGLRIGVTTIKTLAYAVNKPVVSVPALDGLAYNLQACEALVCPIMNARNQQVYTAVYHWDQDLPVNITEYMGIPIEELISIIKGKNKRVIFLGDAVKLHRDLLKGRLQEQCEFAHGGLMLQKASSIARAALVRASKGMSESCFDMLPFYLRKSQAEREYDEKQQRDQR